MGVVFRVEPEMPAEARFLDLPQATCEATTVVAADGTPDSVVVRGCDPLFAEAVHAALVQWRYSPGEATEAQEFVFRAATAFDDLSADALIALTAAWTAKPDREGYCHAGVTLHPDGTATDAWTNRRPLCVAITAQVAPGARTWAEVPAGGLSCLVKFEAHPRGVEVDSVDSRCPYPVATYLAKVVHHWRWNAEDATDYAVTFLLSPGSG